jgi:hypothetical protein
VKHAAMNAAVLLLLGALATPAHADVLVYDCKGQVNFKAQFDLADQTMRYVGRSDKSYGLSRVDDTYLEWAEVDETGISTNSLHRKTGYYTETFVHHRDKRTDITRAVCKPAE